MYAEHTYILKTSDFHIDKENTNPIFPGIAGYLLWNNVLNGLMLFPCSMQNQAGKFTGYKYTALMKKIKNPFYAWTDKLIPKRYPRSRSAKWGLLLLFFSGFNHTPEESVGIPIVAFFKEWWMTVCDGCPATRRIWMLLLSAISILLTCAGTHIHPFAWFLSCKGFPWAILLVLGKYLVSQWGCSLERDMEWWRQTF